jgi:NifU-like protein involved in Fe-S cluster formation
MKNLYQLLLDEHFKNPRNSKVLLDPHIYLTNVNPLCGDSISIQVNYQDEQIKSSTRQQCRQP